MRETLLSAWAATVTSAALTISTAVWPSVFQQYAWVVKYLWVLAVVLWIAWLVMLTRKRHAMPETPANINITRSMHSI